MHTNIMDKSNFKKPGACWLQAGVHVVYYNMVAYYMIIILIIIIIITSTSDPQPSTTIANQLPGQ